MPTINSSRQPVLDRISQHWCSSGICLSQVWENISHNCSQWPKGVSWSWPKVISPRSRSQCPYTGNLCLGHNSSLPCCIWIIFHTIVVHDSRVCHDLDPLSYLWGQGHSAHIPQIYVRAKTPHCQVGSWYYFTHLLSMTEGCVRTLTQGHISEFMVTVHTYPKPCLGHKLSLPSWTLIIYHAIVSWPWLRDISTRSRSQFTHGKIFFPDHYLSWVS